MRLDAEIGRHAGQDHLVDMVLAKLQHEVVVFRPIDLVRRGDDGLAVVDVGLVLRHEIGAGAFESLDRQGALAVEHADLVHQFFQRSAELPAMVGGVVVMRGDRDGHAARLGRLHQALDVVDGAVLFDALADHAPGDAIGAQEIDLRVGHDQRGARVIDDHAAGRQRRLLRVRIGVFRSLRVAGDASGGGDDSRGQSGFQKIAPVEPARFASRIVIVVFTHNWSPIANVEESRLTEHVFHLVRHPCPIIRHYSVGAAHTGL